MTALFVISREPREEIAAVLPGVDVRRDTDLPDHGRGIAILPRAELATILELMAKSERVFALHVDGVPVERLRALVDAPPALPHVTKVGTFYERARAVASVVRFAESRTVPRAVIAAIEQCVDELLVNALHDAPVDEAGRRVFAGVPVQARAALRVPQDVELAYDCDGKQFTIAVRDAFGSLERATVLKFLARGFAEQTVDRKQGGAGLGLFLLLHNASTVAFRVVPGQSTEVRCTFALAGSQLEQLVLDVGNPAPTRAFATHTLPVASPATVRTRRVLALAIATVVLVGGALLVILPRLLAVPPTSTLELDTEPSGAAISIDGKPMGGTPIRLASLSPGAAVAIAVALPGYRDATLRVVAPKANEVQRVVHPLVASEQFAHVRLVSTPPGAQILQNNRELAVGRTYTPATVVVAADQPQQFALVMPGKVPVVLEPIVVPSKASVERAVTLVAGPTLRVEGRGGRVTVEGVAGCTDKRVPATCSLAAGSYAVVHVDGAKTVTRTVQIAGDTTERF